MIHSYTACALPLALLVTACGKDEPANNGAVAAVTADAPVAPSPSNDTPDEGSGDAAYDEAVAAQTPPEGVGDDEQAYRAADSIVTTDVGGSVRAQMVTGWIPLMKLCLQLDPSLAAPGEATSSPLTLADLALRGRGTVTRWEEDGGTLYLTSPFVDDSGQRITVVTSLTRDYSPSPGCPAGTATVISSTLGNGTVSLPTAAGVYPRYVRAAGAR